jgi:hypothetical protein
MWIIHTGLPAPELCDWLHTTRMELPVLGSHFKLGPTPPKPVIFLLFCFFFQIQQEAKLTIGA